MSVSILLHSESLSASFANIGFEVRVSFLVAFQVSRSWKSLFTILTSKVQIFSVLYIDVILQSFPVGEFSATDVAGNGFLSM